MEKPTSNTHFHLARSEMDPFSVTNDIIENLFDLFAEKHVPDK